MKNNFSNQLTFLRQQKKMSQGMLSNKLNISRQSISKWERGESEPSLDTIINLTKIFNVDLNFLLLGKETQKNLLIQGNKLNKKFDKTILNQINFKIFEGDRIALLGGNGAGKSTFIKIIIGLINQSSGEIFRKINCNNDINYLSQENILLEDLSVLEQIQTETEILNINSNQIIEEMITKFNLETQKNKIISNLSGGEKRRLSLLLCNLRTAKLLILDEPTVGMDLASIDYLWNYLYKLGSTVLTITHDFNQIDTYFSRVWLLKDGILYKDVSVDEIHQHNQTIEQWYRNFNDGEET